MPVPRRRTALVLATGALLTALSLLTFAVVAAAGPQPQAPSSFHGSVTLDAGLPPEDAEVRAFVDGVDCTQGGAGSPNTVRVGEAAAYVINVVHEDQRPGCGRDGTTVTFTVGGYPAAQTATWQIGLRRLDLDASSSSPQALSRETVGPAAPADTSAVLASSSDGSSGFPVAWTLAVVLAAVATGGLVTRVALRRRSPAGRGDPPPDS